MDAKEILYAVAIPALVVFILWRDVYVPYRQERRARFRFYTMSDGTQMRVVRPPRDVNFENRTFTNKDKELALIGDWWELDCPVDGVPQEELL